ncbi:serine/threonine-protein kinase [Amycolatopsis sp. NEAU-NG30]|uniref:non-specific serine/threonine protein kinase n=1 Tax=Amycolatopsis melonis TaxID=3156488 RepID=A0ABV0LKB0_9PSEU
MLSSGQLLAERYKLTNRIAVGGMGEVWQASDTRLDRTVAVKILKAELSGDAEFLHRFRTEARMTASLNHPGIAAVHDYGETVFDGDLSIAYLVMELVDGDPLAGLLAKHGRLSAEFTLDMLEQAGNALQAAHEQGLVHRDVKPGNILVTSAGQVKITDFGVAKAADAAPVTRSGMVMGTAHYIAPEQALGHPAEPASDVYSLAVCGYECLAGHRPFLSENAVTVAMMHIRDLPPPLPPDVPPAARAVIEATLVKDPRQRYNNGGEFAAAVAAVRAGLPLPAPSGVVNAAYATGQQPQVQVPQQPVQPQLAPPQQPMPPGPPSPAVNPMVAIGPPSRPAVRPAMVPAHRKKSQWGWWALLAAILLVVLVAGIVLVAKMIGSSGPPTQGGQPTGQVVPGRQPPGEQPTDAANSPGTTDDGRQGIMTTPWTEWNGIQR